MAIEPTGRSKATFDPFQLFQVLEFWCPNMDLWYFNSKQENEHFYIHKLRLPWSSPIQNVKLQITERKRLLKNLEFRYRTQTQNILNESKHNIFQAL